MMLVPFSRPMLYALTRGRAAFASESGLQSAFDWPHPDIADALDWLVGLRESERAMDDWCFLVVQDGRVVGDIGTKGIPVDGLVEVGYGIAASERRRGFASGALMQFLNHCAIHGAHTVTAECHERNRGSIRVLEGARFVQTGTRVDGAERLLCWAKPVLPQSG